MDFRKTFDAIPQQFDKWRPRYCEELYSKIITRTDLGAHKSALEIGPGTGQATEPFLKTGCDYLAIELGKNFAEFMTNKFGTYDNFHIVNDALRPTILETGNLTSYTPLQPYNGFPRTLDFLKYSTF